MFALESDRMLNLKLAEDEFQKERKVVAEERRLRVEDNPKEVLNERLNAIANIATPYHHPIIGWMGDIKAYTLGDLSKWYNTWYAPNNAILVVVGDVKFKEVIELAKKYFGILKSRKLEKLKPQTALKPLGERRVKVEIPAKVPFLHIGYNVPFLAKSTLSHWEPYALMVLNAILGQGKSSRLVRSLVKKQMVATDVFTNYDPYSLYPGLFEITATPSKGHTLIEIEKSILKEIDFIIKKEISIKELEKIKQQVIAQRIYSRDSMGWQAMEIGWLESIGLSWREADKYVEHIQQVTQEQVQTVAKKYLTMDKLVVGNLIPKAVNIKEHTYE